LNILKRHGHRSCLHEKLEDKVKVVIDLLTALERLGRAEAFESKGIDCIQAIFLGLQALLPEIMDSLTWMSTMKAKFL
jgi:hypothetical protein